MPPALQPAHHHHPPHPGSLIIIDLVCIFIQLLFYFIQCGTLFFKALQSL